MSNGILIARKGAHHLQISYLMVNTGGISKQPKWSMMVLLDDDEHKPVKFKVAHTVNNKPKTIQGFQT